MNWGRDTCLFPWFTAAILTGVILLYSVVWWIWMQGLSPLERYYLPTYFRATENAVHPGAKTRLALLYKTAPGRERVALLAPDVVPGTDGDLPLQLSPSALKDGWTGIEKGQPIRYVSLADDLQSIFYEDRGFWQMAREPLLEATAFMSVLLLYLFPHRWRLKAEWRGFYWGMEELGLRLYEWIDLTLPSECVHLSELV